MSTTSGERPARLDTLAGKRLAVPGVIGMRDPSFTVSAWMSDPFDAGRGGQPLPMRSIEVPSEDVYVPIAQMR